MFDWNASQSGHTRRRILLGPPPPGDPTFGPVRTRTDTRLGGTRRGNLVSGSRADHVPDHSARPKDTDGGVGVAQLVAGRTIG